MHAARNGHISISRQRALACRLELASFSHLLWQCFRRQATLGVALPPRGAGAACKCALAKRGNAPAKGAKAASRGTKCHGVRDERPLQDCQSLRSLTRQARPQLRSLRKTAKHPSGILRRSRPFSCEASFPKTIGVKRPALSRGAGEAGAPARACGLLVGRGFGIILGCTERIFVR